MTDPAPTHACPGGCGAQIAQNRLSCPRDWYRLPKDLRTRIWRSFTRADQDGHMEAVLEAADWYRENPRTEAPRG